MRESVRTCAVTGATGYVGGAIARELEARGFKVLRMTRSTGYALEGTPRLPADGLDFVLHAAYDFTRASWPDIQRLNVDGSLRLLEAAGRQRAGKFVFISSLAAYDGCRSYYGQGKRLVERAVLSTGGEVIRPGTVFGKAPRGLMGNLLAQVSRRSWIPVISHKPSLRLTHEEDLASLVVAIGQGEAQATSEPWLAAGKKAWDLQQLVGEMARRVQRRVRIVPVPWWSAWAALRCAESIGLRPAFRSDSVLSLANPAPENQLNALATPHCSFREF